MDDREFTDRFIRRNRALLNEALKESRTSIERGEGVEINSYDEFVAAIARHRRRVSRPKK